MDQNSKKYLEEYIKTFMILTMPFKSKEDFEKCVSEIFLDKNSSQNFDFESISEIYSERIKKYISENYLDKDFEKTLFREKNVHETNNYNENEIDFSIFEKDNN